MNIDSAPYGFKGGVRAWQEHARNQIRRQLNVARVKHLKEAVKLVFEFYLKKSQHESDLDNMLKVTTDALGAGGLFPQSKGGGKKTPYNTDDHWVKVIEAEKHEDQDDARVMIRIFTRQVPVA